MNLQTNILNFIFDVDACAPIENIKDVYVDSFGSIAKVIDGEVMHIYKSHAAPNGYMKVRLIDDDGRRKAHYVHRLVYDSFHSVIDGMVVHHKDTNRTNNALDNLELKTYSDNALEEFRTGRRKRKLNKRQAHHVRVTADDLPAETLADKYKCSPSLIRGIRSGRLYKDV